MKSRGRKYARSRGYIERLEDRLLLSAVTESEPNDSIASANALSADDTATGTISLGGDVDLYKVDLAFGDTLTANIDADVNGSSLDSLLRLFDSTGNEFASNDDDGVTFDSLLTF